MSSFHTEALAPLRDNPLLLALGNYAFYINLECILYYFIAFERCFKHYS